MARKWAEAPQKKRVEIQHCIIMNFIVLFENKY
jgi:hypothetical protein